MKYLIDVCFQVFSVDRTMFEYVYLILVCTISTTYIIIGRLCSIIITLFANQYQVHNYYVTLYILWLLCILACVILSFTLTTWLIGRYVDYGLGLFIACIKNDANLYLFLFQRYLVVTNSSLTYMIRYNSNKVINAIIPMMNQRELHYAAEVAYKYNKAELLLLILPRITNIQPVIYDICGRLNGEYDVLKICVDYGLDHRYISKTQTAQLLNNGYDLKNKYAYTWRNVRQKRQKSISRTLNELPIKEYDINISNIITSYMPYEHILTEQTR